MHSWCACTLAWIVLCKFHRILEPMPMTLRSQKILEFISTVFDRSQYQIHLDFIEKYYIFDKKWPVFGKMLLNKYHFNFLWLQFAYWHQTASIVDQMVWFLHGTTSHISHHIKSLRVCTVASILQNPINFLQKTVQAIVHSHTPICLSLNNDIFDTRWTLRNDLRAQFLSSSSPSFWLLRCWRANGHSKYKNNIKIYTNRIAKRVCTVLLHHSI